MSYYVLDTDHLSILQRKEKPAFTYLTQRLEKHSPDDIFATIISFQEQFQGWMAYINKARSASKLVEAYRRLGDLIRLYSISNTLPFDEQAAVIAANLRKQHKRLGIMDIRIAAITLSNDAILLTRNRNDFRHISTLNTEDWTI